MSNTGLKPLAPTAGRVPESRRATVVNLTPTRKTRFERTESAPRRLHQFFEITCDRTPDALALVCGDKKLTYAALDAEANRLAHFLIAPA